MGSTSARPPAAPDPVRRRERLAPKRKPDQPPCKSSTYSPRRIPQPFTDKEIAAARAVLGLAQGGRKIRAIKQYREMTGRGLKDAKDTIYAVLLIRAC